MGKEGNYIYCIIETRQERNFGPIGVGDRGDEVLTIGYNDLSMVISKHPLTKFTLSSENFLAHEIVIEEVMKEFDGVLPVRFGTIASSTDEIRNLLDRRYREFKNSLKGMDHKIELGVKGIWRNIKVIFKEIEDENNEIQKQKMKILKGMRKKTSSNKREFYSLNYVKAEIGRAVQEALERKKEEESENFVEILRKISIDYRLNKTSGNEMFMNAAFLVDKGREKEFDNIMDDLSREHEERIKFVYTGPLPVFNFVNIVIYPEEWEK